MGRDRGQRVRSPGVWGGEGGQWVPQSVGECRCEHVSQEVCANPAPTGAALGLSFSVSRFLRACGYVVYEFLDLAVTV